MKARAKQMTRTKKRRRSDEFTGQKRRWQGAGRRRGAMQPGVQRGLWLGSQCSDGARFGPDGEAGLAGFTYTWVDDREALCLPSSSSPPSAHTCAPLLHPHEGCRVTCGGCHQSPITGAVEFAAAQGSFAPI